MRWTIFFGTVLTLVVIGGAGYLGYRASRPVEGAVIEAPPTIPVDRGDVVQSVSAPGQLVGMREQILSFDVAGRLSHLHTRAGDSVKAGTVLAELTDGTFTYPLIAPFDGVVQEVSAQLGEMMNAGDPVIQLLDPATLEARTTVTEEDYPLIQLGQPAELYFDAQPDLVVTGTVTTIVPLRDASSDSPIYPVYIALESVPDGLAPGMTVDSLILIAQRTAVLRLPRSLVRARSDGSAEIEVWANGQTETRTVQTGLRGDQYVEILSGLAEGDQVVTQ